MKSESEIYVEAEIYAKTEKEKRLFGQRVSRCISTEEFQSEAYTAGFLKCQKEYEEKLRWIPVDEKMPEQLTYIELKDSCDRIFSGSLNMQNEFRDRLHNDRLHFIVSWRSFL